jgi:hypothetical protein
MLKSFCPICKKQLAIDRNLKASCPDPKCSFVDRRRGRSMIAEDKERRGEIPWDKTLCR